MDDEELWKASAYVVALAQGYCVTHLQQAGLTLSSQVDGPFFGLYRSIFVSSGSRTLSLGYQPSMYLVNPIGEVNEYSPLFSLRLTDAFYMPLRYPPSAN
jgi:hypothetical protein